MLQQKNKILKELRGKDPQKEEMAKREQGFALYVNGENAKSRKNKKTSRGREVLKANNSHPQKEENCKLSVCTYVDVPCQTKLNQQLYIHTVYISVCSWFFGKC